MDGVEHAFALRNCSKSIAPESACGSLWIFYKPVYQRNPLLNQSPSALPPGDEKKDSKSSFCRHVLSLSSFEVTQWHERVNSQELFGFQLFQLLIHLRFFRFVDIPGSCATATVPPALHRRRLRYQKKMNLCYPFEFGRSNGVLSLAGQPLYGTCIAHFKYFFTSFHGLSNEN